MRVTFQDKWVLEPDVYEDVVDFKEGILSTYDLTFKNGKTILIASEGVKSVTIEDESNEGEILCVSINTWCV